MDNHLATVLDGTFWRYHSKRHFNEGMDFYKTFEDGPWKWQSRERFSPSHLACGHYFSLTKEATLAEAKTYKVNERKRLLLGFDLHVDGILDLTQEDILLDVYKQLTVNSIRPKLHIFRMLIHDDIGGNAMTDEFGFWAVRQGYKGILYFSARSLKQHKDNFMSSADYQWGLYVAGDIFSDLRIDSTTQNIVIFSGRYLTPNIRAYWKRNIWQRRFFQFDNPIMEFLLVILTSSLSMIQKTGIIV